MSYAFEQEEMREEAAEKLRRWLFWGVAGLVGVGVGGYFLFLAPNKAPTKHKAPPITIVNLPPPPPPPPPKKEPEPPKPEEKEVEQKQEMVMQDPVQENEPPPQEAPAPAPAADIGTGIVGNGPSDGFGLSAKGGGMRIGGGGGLLGAKGSKYGWFAAQVQRRVAAALQSHPLLRTAEFRPVSMKIWYDTTGRATRVSLEPTGNSKIDQALRDALTGAQVTDAHLGDRELPPMPINMRLKAARPQAN